MFNIDQYQKDILLANFLKMIIIHVWRKLYIFNIDQYLQGISWENFLKLIIIHFWLKLHVANNIEQYDKDQY